MVSFYMFEKIRKLKLEGKSNAEIARELKINPKTVCKYLKCNTPPRYKPRSLSTRENPLDGFEEKVKTWITRTAELTDQEIYELLISECYKGSERTLNRRIKALRPSKPKER